MKNGQEDITKTKRKDKTLTDNNAKRLLYKKAAISSTLISRNNCFYTNFVI